MHASLKSVQSFKSFAPTALVALLSALSLTACGGSDEIPTAALEAHAATLAAPLLDDDGRVVPASPLQVPTDAAARTRSGHYASGLQAGELERALRGGVLHVVVDEGGAEQAVAIARGLQAAQDLPDNAPVLVRGHSLRDAAAVADRLADEGMTRVFLVTH